MTTDAKNGVYTCTMISAGGRTHDLNRLKNRQIIRPLRNPADTIELVHIRYRTRVTIFNHPFAVMLIPHRPPARRAEMHPWIGETKMDDFRDYDEDYADGLDMLEDGLDGYDVEPDGFEQDAFGDDFLLMDSNDFDGITLDGIDEWGFLKKAWGGIKNVAKAVAPIAKKLAPFAGKAIGMALGGPAGAAVGGMVGNVVSNLEDGYEAMDGDTPDEMDAEEFYAPDSLDDETAEAMAHAASKAKSSDAAALAAGAASTLAGKAPAKVKAVMPTVTSASANVAKVMAKHPKAKVLTKTLPTIQKRTIATLSKKAAKGKAVTPTVAKRVMAKHATKVLNSPSQIATALAKNETKRRSLNKKAVMSAEKFI